MRERKAIFGPARPDSNLRQNGNEYQREILGDANTVAYRAALEKYVQGKKITQPRDIPIPDLRQIIADNQPEYRRDFLNKLEGRLRVRFDVDTKPGRTIHVYTSVLTLYDYLYGADAFVVYKDNTTNKQVVFTIDVTLDPDSRENRVDAVIFGDINKSPSAVLRALTDLIENKIMRTNNNPSGRRASTEHIYV